VGIAALVESLPLGSFDNFAVALAVALGGWVMGW
jgi:hypothetical protein